MPDSWPSAANSQPSAEPSFSDAAPAPIAFSPEGGAWGPEAGNSARLESSLHLSGVYLLTSRDDERIAVPGLGLTLDNEGVTVSKPDGSVAVHIPASQLTSVQVSARSETPDGAPALIVETATPQRVHRFVVPVTGASDLLQSLSTYSPDAENLPIEQPSSTPGEFLSPDADTTEDAPTRGNRLIARIVVGIAMLAVTVAVVALLLIGLSKI